MKTRLAKALLTSVMLLGLTAMATPALASTDILTTVNFSGSGLSTESTKIFSTQRFTAYSDDSIYLTLTGWTGVSKLTFTPVHCGYPYNSIGSTATVTSLNVQYTVTKTEACWQWKVGNPQLHNYTFSGKMTYNT